WQWLHNEVVLTNGEKVTRELVNGLIDGEVAVIAAEASGDTDLNRAVELLRQVALDDGYADFLTLPGYEQMP
ncbi:MAG: malate synthase A, partial [Stackebrandtia sp.]